MALWRTKAQYRAPAPGLQVSSNLVGLVPQGADSKTRCIPALAVDVSELRHASADRVPCTRRWISRTNASWNGASRSSSPAPCPFPGRQYIVTNRMHRSAPLHVHHESDEVMRAWRLCVHPAWRSSRVEERRIGTRLRPVHVRTCEGREGVRGPCGDRGRAARRWTG